MEHKSILIKNGLLFNGSKAEAKVQNLLIKNGKIVKLSQTEIPIDSSVKVIDAAGKWVMPGFIDIHTHYDAEIEAIPSLHESVRHGISTVFLGSCSLSVALGTAEDLADTFTRVEAIPREHLLPLLENKKSWNTIKEYVDHFSEIPIGPNVASYVGYSTIRSYVMGLKRSLTKGEKPTPDEIKKIKSLIEEGFDEGLIGLSVNTLYWDKMGGERFNSHCLPSTYASWKELREVISLARKRNLVLQTIPNISTKYEVFIYALFSAGLFFRKALKISLVSLMDIRSNRIMYKVLQGLGFIFNKVLRGDFRYQSLPTPFDLYADGVDIVVFEEFGAGAAALHLQNAVERRKLLEDPNYRSWFKRQWKNPLLPKVFHRNFSFAIVKECPDDSLVGKSFTEIAKEKSKDVVDTFLDLVCEYGTKLRWYTVMGNDRKKALGSIMNYSNSMIGFSDAGAHLRNMAYYNFPLRMLKFIKDSHEEGKPLMSLEKAVWRLTGEIADWYNLDAGYIKEGSRADVLVIDPEGLDESVDEIHEEAMEEFGSYKRLVRRNPKAVQTVMINGNLAVDNYQLNPNLGKKKGFGKFLKVKTKE